MASRRSADAFPPGAVDIGAAQPGKLGAGPKAPRAGQGPGKKRGKNAGFPGAKS